MNKPASKWAYDLIKTFPALRKAARRVLLAAGRARYTWQARSVPIEPKTIMFESYMGRSYSCSPRALYEEMLGDSRFDDYTFIWAFRDCEDRRHTPELLRARLVEFGSPAYDNAHARAADWVTNSRLADYLTKKAGQRYIQTWHGTPFKRLGLDIVENSQGVMNDTSEVIARNNYDALRYDAMLSPSPFCSEKLRSAFALDQLLGRDIILELGYPRNDRLARATAADCEEVRRRLTIPENKKVCLYAPTWRDNQHASGIGYTLNVELDFNRMRQQLGDEWVVIFRAHYLIAQAFDFRIWDGFVIDGSQIDDVNDCYLAADVLITDYSSVFFDYANLSRPMVFFLYDLEEYQQELHGFYFGLEDLPGPIVRTTDEVCHALSSIDDSEKEYADTYQRFTHRFNPLDDGRASRRVIDALWPE